MHGSATTFHNRLIAIWNRWYVSVFRIRHGALLILQKDNFDDGLVFSHIRIRSHYFGERYRIISTDPGDTTYNR